MTTALQRQIGGNHYKGFAIQPVQYTHANGLSFLAGCVLKRICRFNQPGGKGRQDLEKAIHELELCLELNEQHADEPAPHLDCVSKLPISPRRFFKENQLAYWQLDVVVMLTTYNRKGRLDDLTTAKDIILDAIRQHYPI